MYPVVLEFIPSFSSRDENVSVLATVHAIGIGTTPHPVVLFEFFELTSIFVKLTTINKFQAHQIE